MKGERASSIPLYALGSVGFKSHEDPNLRRARIDNG